MPLLHQNREIDSSPEFEKHDLTRRHLVQDPFVNRVASYYVDAKRRSTRTSAYLQRHSRLSQLEHSLQQLSYLGSGWDSYGAAPPSPAVIMRAYRLIHRLRGKETLPSTVVASAEGGVAFMFGNEHRTAYLEFQNNGEVLAAMYEHTGEPIVKDITKSDPDATGIIGEFQQYLRTKQPASTSR